MPKSVRINSDGQVTIPETIRSFLGTDVVEFRIENDRVVVEPRENAGDSLAALAREYRPIEETRDAAWGKVAEEKDRPEPD